MRSNVSEFACLATGVCQRYSEQKHKSLKKKKI